MATPRAFEQGVESRVGASSSRSGWGQAVGRRVGDGETLANALGWFSIGLGVLELAATEPLCEFLGMEDRQNLVRLYGLREVAKGVGILANRRPEGWMWARIAGDLLDIGTLATALTPDNRQRDNVMLEIGAVAGVTALDVICARQLRASRR